LVKEVQDGRVCRLKNGKTDGARNLEKVSPDKRKISIIQSVGLQGTRTENRDTLNDDLCVVGKGGGGKKNSKSPKPIYWNIMGGGKGDWPVDSGEGGK